MPFCPRCNESVTAVDNKCPGCQRSFASASDAKVDTGWQSMLKAAQLDAPVSLDDAPTKPVFELSEEEMPEHWKKKKLEAEKPPPPPPPKVRKPPPVAPLLAVAALGTVMCLFVLTTPAATPPVSAPVAPSPASALPAPDPSKVLEEAVAELKQKHYARSSSLFEEARQRGAKLTPAQSQSRKRANLALSGELFNDARKALAAKNWNQAVSLAEQSANLNRAYGGDAQQRNKAESLVAEVNARLSEARASRVEENPQQPSQGSHQQQPEGAEQPKLDEGPAFPTSSYRAHGGGGGKAPAAAPPEPQTGSADTPRRAAQVPAGTRPASTSGGKPARLGDQGVVPTYSRTASQASSAPGYSGGSRFRR